MPKFNWEARTRSGKGADGKTHDYRIFFPNKGISQFSAMQRVMILVNIYFDKEEKLPSAEQFDALRELRARNVEAAGWFVRS